MTLLAMAFREQMKQTKDFRQMSEMTYSVSYSTGFLPLDYAAGYIQEINGHYRYELGLSDGSINTLIGASGTGKTSLLVSVACSIIKRFKTSNIFFEQAEVGTNIQRIKNLSGYQTDEEFLKRFVVRDAGITIESIYKRVLAIHDYKISHQDEFLYNTGIIDMNGKPLLKFEPTIYIIDSVKLIMSEKNTEAEDTNNMTGATNAKIASEYYTKMVPLCREANIIMILVNHITEKINTGFFPTKAEFPYLAQNEHLSSARLLQYISNTMFKLSNSSKLDSADDKNPFGISGSLVNIDIIKSRTSKSGKARCVLVFDQEIGFDRDLSMLMMLKQNDILQGRGYYTLPGSDIKFTMKNFKEMLYTNTNFHNEFISFCFKYISGLLMEDYDRIKTKTTQLNNGQSTYDAIIDQFNQISMSSATNTNI